MTSVVTNMIRDQGAKPPSRHQGAQIAEWPQTGHELVGHVQLGNGSGLTGGMARLAHIRQGQARQGNSSMQHRERMSGADFHVTEFNRSSVWLRGAYHAGQWTQLLEQLHPRLESQRQDSEHSHSRRVGWGYTYVYRTEFSKVVRAQ